MVNDVENAVHNHHEQARAVRGWTRLPVAVSDGLSATDHAAASSDWDILIVGRILTAIQPAHMPPTSWTDRRPRQESAGKIIALNQNLTDQTRQLMTIGAPYISARTPSDYWLYARLFSSTCPVAVVDEQVVALQLRSGARTIRTTSTCKTS